MKKTIIITGVSSGVGKSIAIKLLEEGHTVIGLSRRQPSISHENFFFTSVDLTRFNEVEKLFSSLLQKYPALDTLIYSAGRGSFGYLEQISFEEVPSLFSINVFSPILLTKMILPHLKSQGGGDILFIGSEASLETQAQGSIYSASKFALRGFAKSLRKECASSQVRVTLLQPGMVQTPFYENCHFEPMAKPLHSLQPEDVAEMVSFLLQLPSRAICEEIFLSPMKKGVQTKKSKKEDNEVF